MRKKLLIPIILCAFLMTSCGNSSDSFLAEQDYYDNNSIGYDGEYDYELADVDESSAESNDYDEESLSSETIKKEMLVYSCNMTVDVLNFEEAIDSFKESLDSYGGFVETESYSDGGSSSRYYYEDEEKWQTYSATVRIPSADYDNFCNSAASLGDLRSKNATVENVSSEYYDLSTTLEIYEAKEQRYIDMLSDITDDEYAIAVEKELTELQVQIAQIRTRMNEIRTDVAYSYVYINLNEVKEYKAEPVKKDTFGQRLTTTLSETASDFLIFLEGLLFLIIHLLPYLVLIGIIVVIIIKIIRRAKARKAARVKADTAMNNTNGFNYPQNNISQQGITPSAGEVNSQTELKEDNFDNK